MKKDLIYFSENGLTSTSANHIANLAKEYYQTLETELDNIKLYDTKVALIGNSSPNLLSEGNTISFIESIEDKLLQISNAKSLIAWLREAIKAKDNLLRELRSMSLEEYCTMKGVLCPIRPEREDSLDEDTYLSKLSVKDRNRYFELQTKCAVIGKYIHPDGQFANARKDLKDKISNPNRVSGNGRDTLLYSYTPTVPKETVDTAFYKLQVKHREYQAELNGILHSMQQAIEKDNFEKNTAYMQQLAEYNNAVNTLHSEMKDYLEKEQSNISHLKIIIPNSLISIYNEINKLGK